MCGSQTRNLCSHTFTVDKNQSLLSSTFPCPQWIKMNVDKDPTSLPTPAPQDNIATTCPDGISAAPRDPDNCVVLCDNEKDADCVYACDGRIQAVLCTNICTGVLDKTDCRDLCCPEPSPTSAPTRSPQSDIVETTPTVQPALNIVPTISESTSTPAQACETDETRRAPRDPDNCIIMCDADSQHTTMSDFFKRGCRHPCPPADSDGRRRSFCADFCTTSLEEEFNGENDCQDACCPEKAQPTAVPQSNVVGQPSPEPSSLVAQTSPEPSSVVGQSSPEPSSMVGQSSPEPSSVVGQSSPEPSLGLTVNATCNRPCCQDPCCITPS